MKTFRLFVIAVLGVLLVSCGGFNMVVKEKPPETISPATNKATLVVYRGTSLGFGISVDNFLDKKFIGQTRGKSFFISTVDPGEKYLVASAENKATAKIKLEAGKVYYLLQAMYPGFMTARTGLIGSNEIDFKKDFLDLKYYECCKKGKLPNLDANSYNDLVAEYDKESIEDPDRHKDTYNLKGF